MASFCMSGCLWHLMRVLFRVQRIVGGRPGYTNSSRPIAEPHSGGGVALVRPGGEQLSPLSVVADNAARAGGSFPAEAD